MTSDTGIYVITNTVNENVYIGHTGNSFRQRWSQHRSNLRGGRHRNPHLQRSWNKYGESTFEFGVLEYLNRQGELHLAEQFWMDVYRKEGKELYNHGLVARSPWLGCSRTKETRRKMSEAQKGNTKVLGHELTEEHKRRIGEANAGSYPAFINQYTGEIIPAGVGLSTMCRDHGLNLGAMSMVKNGQRPFHKGWILLSEHLQPWLL